MGAGTQFGQQGLMDAMGAPPGVYFSCTLPYGGQRGTGAKFEQGRAIGVISTTPANEVRTLTLTAATGTVTVTWTFASGVVQASWPAAAANATVLAAIVAAIPGWSGNVAVTGTPGSTVIVTFSNQLAQVAIGGNWLAAVSGGSAVWTVTTAGSSAVQYDVYNSATNNDVDGFLLFDVKTDPTGARVPADVGGVAGNTASGASFCAEGLFNAADLVGLDANAFTLGKLTKKAGGTLVRLV